MFRALKKDIPAFLHVDGYDVALRHNKRAKRYTLRFNSKKQKCILTLPRRFSLDAAYQFLGQKRFWIEEQHQKYIWPHPKNTILLHGTLYNILWKDSRGLQYEVNRKENTLTLLCPKSKIERCCKKALVSYAKEQIEKYTQRTAQAHHIPFQNLSIKDTLSRWGSCSSNGQLNFSWRLVMAPDDVIDYVVAHELAHIKHMNHSADFWSWCDQLSNNMAFGKQWIKDNGTLFHAWQSETCLDQTIL